MHCIELARLAAIIAAQGPALVTSRSLVSAEATVQYWSASRQRFELWNRGLGRLTELLKAGRSVAARDWWQEHLAMLEEILVSETLTRVMAAVGAALDGNDGQGDVEPLTQSVFLTHLEARNRVLRLLLFGRGGSVDQSLRLNRLRRGVERWTDHLLSPLVKQHGEVLRFAHDRGRARAFGEEAAEALGACEVAIANHLTLAALQASLAQLCGPRAALPQANHQLAQAVLVCLPPELFDSHGLLCSSAARRLRVNDSPECRPRRGQPMQHLLMTSLPAPASAPHLVRWTF